MITIKLNMACCGGNGLGNNCCCVICKCVAATGPAGPPGPPAAGSLGAAVIPFSLAGAVVFGALPAGTPLSVGFGQTLVAGVIPGIGVPGTVYFRVPRSGVVRNLYFSIQTNLGISVLGTTLTATIFRASNTGDPPVTAVPPTFVPTPLSTSVDIPALGLGGFFRANANITNALIVAAGDYLALGVTFGDVLATATVLTTIAGGVEIQ